MRLCDIKYIPARPWRNGNPFRPAVTALVFLLVASGCSRSTSDELSTTLTQCRELRDEARMLNSKALAETDIAAQRRLLEESLAKDEMFGEAHNNLGIVLHRQGDIYGSAAHFERAAELLPGSPTPWVNLALLHAELGQWERALPYARKAYERDPHHPDAVRALAACLVENGVPDKESETTLSRLAVLAPDEKSRQWATRHLYEIRDQQEPSK